MVCSKREGRRRAAGTSACLKTRQLATLPYKQNTIYVRIRRVYFMVASYWLIDNFTSITRAADAAPKYIRYRCTCTYVVARAIYKHNCFCQQTEMVTEDPRSNPAVVARMVNVLCAGRDTCTNLQSKDIASQISSTEQLILSFR